MKNSNLENEGLEITERSKGKRRMKKRDKILRELKNRMKKIIEEENKKGTENIFEAIMAKTFQTWKEKSTSRSMRPKGFQKIEPE